MYNSIRQCKKKKKNQTFEFIKEAWKILSDKRIIYTMDRIARSLRFVSMQCPGRGRSRLENENFRFEDLVIIEIPVDIRKRSAAIHSGSTIGNRAGLDSLWFPSSTNFFPPLVELILRYFHCFADWNLVSW